MMSNVPEEVAAAEEGAEGVVVEVEEERKSATQEFGFPLVQVVEAAQISIWFEWLAVHLEYSRVVAVAVAVAAESYQYSPQDKNWHFQLTASYCRGLIVMLSSLIRWGKQNAGRTVKGSGGCCKCFLKIIDSGNLTLGDPTITSS